MEWDVIEVQAEPPLSLNVQFADGNRGYVRFEPSHLTGVFESLLGNYGAYGLGSRLGHLVPLRWGRWIGITAPRLEKTACFFKRHGPVAVMLGRVIVPLRQLQGYVAGSAKMSFSRIAWWSLLGAVAWFLAWGVVGSGICTAGVRKRVTWIRLHLICQGMLYNEVSAPTHWPCACPTTP